MINAVFNIYMNKLECNTDTHTHTHTQNRNIKKKAKQIGNCTQKQKIKNKVKKRMENLR